MQYISCTELMENRQVNSINTLVDRAAGFASAIPLFEVEFPNSGSAPSPDPLLRSVENGPKHIFRHVFYDFVSIRQAEWHERVSLMLIGYRHRYVGPWVWLHISMLLRHTHDRCSAYVVEFMIS